MTIDAQVMLDMMRQQLNWIEREMFLLRQMLNQPASKETPPTFESLRGIWAGVVFDEEDFQASRLRLPEGL